MTARYMTTMLRKVVAQEKALSGGLPTCSIKKEYGIEIQRGSLKKKSFCGRVHGNLNFIGSILAKLHVGAMDRGKGNTPKNRLHLLNADVATR